MPRQLLPQPLGPAGVKGPTGDRGMDAGPQLISPPVPAATSERGWDLG